MQLFEGALGDRRNAQALAVASDLAYLPPGEGAEAFRAQLGLDAKLISVDNTQAYVAHNDDHLVLAFRGTEAPTSIEGLKDWLLTDAVNLLIVPEGRMGTDFLAAGVGARFHQGFVGAITEVWGPVYEAVEAEQKRKERPLWITGHSLGGALAQLAAWLFLRRTVSVHQVYTYGAPMVGNEDVAKAFDREFPDQVYRYINGPDPIPRLPTLSLIANKYLHCQKEMTLGAAGASAAAAGSAVELFQAMAGKCVDGLLHGTLIDDLWDHVKQRVGAHATTSYLEQIKGLFQ